MWMLLQMILSLLLTLCNYINTHFYDFKKKNLKPLLLKFHYILLLSLLQNPSTCSHDTVSIKKQCLKHFNANTNKLQPAYTDLKILVNKDIYSPCLYCFSELLKLSLIVISSSTNITFHVYLKTTSPPSESEKRVAFSQIFYSFVLTVILTKQTNISMPILIISLFQSNVLWAITLTQCQGQTKLLTIQV